MKRRDFDTRGTITYTFSGYVIETQPTIPDPPTPPVPPGPEPHDYSQDYFTIVAKENGTITFTYDAGDESSTFTSMSYSKNNGEWVTTNYDSENGNVVTVNVSSGDKVIWKGINNSMYCFSEKILKELYSNITSDCLVDVEGNIMSLLFGDNFVGQTSLQVRDSLFVSFFYHYYHDEQSGEDFEFALQIVSAENLVLPATTLTQYCYEYMFYGCTSLTTAPELPATTLAEGCYSSMFNNCTSLTTAPELPATTLAGSCYQAMFNNCTSLTTAPELPATTLAEGCYSNMFFGCSSLNYIKCLATNISASGCTIGWVDGVDASGTFVKDASMSSWTTGVNGIPEDWTVQDAA